jgi:hypothetical protein
MFNCFLRPLKVVPASDWRQPPTEAGGVHVLAYPVMEATPHQHPAWLPSQKLICLAKPVVDFSW